jgi:uncharacterized protein (TIGR03435 family)
MLRENHGAHSASRTRNLILCTFVLAAITVAFVFVPLRATPRAAQAQAENPVAAVPVYEYESVRIQSSNPAPPNPVMGSLFSPVEQHSTATGTPYSYVAKSLPLFRVIQSAYGIFDDEQLSGLPGWTHFQGYSIHAEIAPSVVAALQKLAPDERKLARQQMLQALLADHFGLRVHRETKNLPIYSLVVAKYGSKLKVADPAAAPNVLHWLQGAGPTPNGTTMTAQAVSMAYLARELSEQVRRSVVDKTGLPGNYNFRLEFTAPQHALGGMLVPADAAPPIFVALQDQLGLKLASTKGPAEVLVIDHVEKPSANLQKAAH